MSPVMVTGLIRTLDEARPTAEALLADNGVIVTVGNRVEVESLARAGRRAHRVDVPPPAVVVPGLVDPHLHLLAMAAERLSVDLSAANSVPDICGVIAVAAGRLAPDLVVRGSGYDDVFLREGRHPTRDELDQAAPCNPVLIRHRSGHAAVANTQALELIGARGHATGLLSGTDTRLARLPRIDRITLEAAVRCVSRELAAHGVCAVGDATFDNDLGRYEFLTRLIANGALLQRLTFHPAAAHVHAFARAGLEFGASGQRWRIGHAKVLANEDEYLDAVPRLVGDACAAGFAAAVHVLDIGPLEVVLRALTEFPAPAGGFHRIEHLALSLPEQIAGVVASGSAVVTQPSFLIHRAKRYERELSEIEKTWLYRVHSLQSAGVTVAASSDAPVAPARPLESVRAMLERSPVSEQIDIGDALALVTRRAAIVGGDHGGWIRPGGPADWVVLGADPVTCRYGDLDTIPVLATWCDGVLLYHARRATWAAPTEPLEDL